MDEIYNKNTLRNYSAIKAPARGKMEMTMLNKTHGVT